MVITDSRDDSDLSLAEFLSSRARHSSDARLALDVAVGVLFSIGAALWRGPGWYVFVCAASCFAAYGAWGIADRELTEREAAGRPIHPSLRVARAAASFVGFAAALLFALTALGAMIGRVIS